MPSRLWYQWVRLFQSELIFFVGVTATTLEGSYAEPFAHWCGFSFALIFPNIS